MDLTYCKTLKNVDKLIIQIENDILVEGGFMQNAVNTLKNLKNRNLWNFT